MENTELAGGKKASWVKRFFSWIWMQHNALKNGTPKERKIAMIKLTFVYGFFSLVVFNAALTATEIHKEESARKAYLSSPEGIKEVKEKLAAEEAKKRLEEEAEAKAKARKEIRDAMAMLVAIQEEEVLKRLRDPDSVQWQAKYVNLKTGATCYSYRAKNGFGGYVDDGMVIVDNKITSSDKVWNKHCADGNGNTFEHFY